MSGTERLPSGVLDFPSCIGYRVEGRVVFKKGWSLRKGGP